MELRVQVEAPEPDQLGSLRHLLSRDPGLAAGVALTDHDGGLAVDLADTRLVPDLVRAIAAWRTGPNGRRSFTVRCRATAVRIGPTAPDPLGGLLATLIQEARSARREAEGFPQPAGAWRSAGGGYGGPGQTARSDGFQDRPAGLRPPPGPENETEP